MESFTTPDEPRTGGTPVIRVLVLVALMAWGARGGTVVNLDADSPYYPNRGYPKLVTPPGVGEAGVDAVVIFAIDDMKDHRRYETFLRPILDRLKAVDGRAALSIMTNKIDPATLLLQQWIKEGLSIETHTVEHPCPVLAGGDFERAKGTFDRCVDQISAIANNVPVAFRTPCCDSLNTPSPRLYAEIFNKVSPGGHFLAIDSSVFNITSANDPELAREIVFDPRNPGRERFRKYVPFESFVNTIEDYPYPYVIGQMCWEFPCATPSDWQAQFVQQPANPITTEDWKALLDATVAKRGVMTMVFHPYGWSTPEMHVALIDYATTKYGKRVMFLNFREAYERLIKNLLDGHPLRDEKGGDNGVRMVDLNGDGFLDVVFSKDRRARVWSATAGKWETGEYPAELRAAEELVGDGRGYLRDLDHDGRAELIVGSDVYRWDGKAWGKAGFSLPAGTSIEGGGFFVDLNEDGIEDFLFSNAERSAVYLFESMAKGWTKVVFDSKRGDPKAKMELPPIVRADGSNNGMWVHSRTLWWQNEDTAKLPNLVDRRRFSDLLKESEPLAKSAAASLASIRVAPGFKVELVAAEPLVMDPMAFAWGPDGKLWVVEMADYPLGMDGKGKPGGRVRYLESTRGDGVYDKSTLFLDGVPYPTSVLPWRKGVLVAAAPEIFYAEDADGDGKADKREVLFTGFHPGNQQHRLNHLQFGLDNWIYGSNGDSGGMVRSIKTGKSVSISGRDFRFRPETGEFEAIAGRSQFGRSRTDGGDWFGCDNSNPLWHYPLEEKYLSRNPHVPATPGLLRVDVPVTPGASEVYPISVTRERFNNPFSANHFTSACSVHVYRDELLGGEKSHGDTETQRGEYWVFTSEPVHNLVHREVMVAQGSTFSSRRAPGEEKSEFLVSSDEWFRPTTIDTGPDGALYVADMYRAVIEHPEWIPKDWQARLDLRAGHDKGRIYRVSPVGSRLRGVPRLDGLDTAGLVGALDSANGWQRDLAQRMILWRADAGAIPLLEKTVVESKNPLARLHALCALEGLAEISDLKFEVSKLNSQTVGAALADASPLVRRHAVRVFEGMLGKSAQVPEGVLKLAEDSDAQVRMQVAYALGAWDDPRAAAGLARLASFSGGDPYLTAAVLSSLNEGNVSAFASAVMELAGKSGAPPSPGLLSGLLRTASGTGRVGAIAAPLAALTTAVDGKFAAWQFQTLGNFLDSLEQSNLSLKKLASEGEALARAAGGVDQAIAAARRMVGDADAALELRAAAVPLLGREASQRAEDWRALDVMLSPQAPREIQSAVIRTLSRRRDVEAGRMLLAHWAGLTPELRGAAMDALLSRAETANLVLDAIEGKSLAVRDIDAPRRQRLLQSSTPAVRTRAAKLLAETVNPDRQKVIDAFADLLILKGDVSKGREIFAKACAQCHRLGDPPVGNAVGPDLASVGDKSAQGLMIAILDPNRAVEARYVNYIATTVDDETFTGLLAGETATSITLLGPEGKQETILRSQLKELRSSNMSLMPDGLEAGLKAQDMADLIGFVRGGK